MCGAPMGGMTGGGMGGGGMKDGIVGTIGGRGGGYDILAKVKNSSISEVVLFYFFNVCFLMSFPF